MRTHVRQRQQGMGALQQQRELSASAGATRHSAEVLVNGVGVVFVWTQPLSLLGRKVLTSLRAFHAVRAVRCPGETACHGHGQCMSIRLLSLEADADSPLLRFDYGVDPNNAQTFDRDSILGCKCDPGYEGYDCSQQSCPRGDDPITGGQVDEIQLLKCAATGGTFRLLYRASVSSDIPFDASPSVLRAILIASLDFEDAIVELSSGASACSPAVVALSSAQNVIKITFPIDHGNLPPLRADTTFLKPTV